MARYRLLQAVVVPVPGYRSNYLQGTKILVPLKVGAEDVSNTNKNKNRGAGWAAPTPTLPVRALCPLPWMSLGHTCNRVKHTGWQEQIGTLARSCVEVMAFPHLENGVRQGTDRIAQSRHSPKVLTG